MDFKPSKYQKDIFSAVKSGKDNLIIVAVAGSGKTKTAEESMKLVPNNLSIGYFAYNKHIAEAFKPRATKNTQVMTTHSYGLKLISRSYLCPRGSFPKVDSNKVYSIIQQMFKTDFLQLTEDQSKAVKPLISKIVSLMKSNLLEATKENVEMIMDKHGFEDEYEIGLPIITDIVSKILYQCKTQIRTIDFDDMLWYPIIYNLKVESFNTFDRIFTDETQDFNPNQIALILKACKPTTKVIAVGDPDQSLYGFRGADTEAMSKVQKALNAKELPLSITYRCPKSHVEIAKKFVTKIEAAEWAEDGKVIQIKEKDLISVVHDKDMMICRYNAPLIKYAFILIKAGFKVIIKGKDIGEGLIRLIDKIAQSGEGITPFLIKLDEWKAKEVRKARELHKNPETINDKYDCIVAIAEECDKVSELRNKIQTIFSDGNASITLSSIHRAKGLEADNVFILKPSLMPSEYAEKAWEQKQEINCQYVAYTRAKKIMYLVE